MERRWNTSLRGRCMGVGIAAMLWACVSSVHAQGTIGVPGQLGRRDWWVKAPGGSYGLMEVKVLDRTMDPSKARSRTSILVGPWRWTFDATAPQVLTVMIIPLLVGGFTYGWIRTRRR